MALIQRGLGTNPSLHLKTSGNRINTNKFPALFMQGFFVFSWLVNDYGFGFSDLSSNFAIGIFAHL